MADWLELAQAERKLAKSARKLFEDGLVPEDFHDHHIQCAEYWERKALTWHEKCDYTGF